MVGRLKDHIDKDLFVQSLYRLIDNYDQFIIDLFVSNSCNLHCKHCYFLDYKPEGTPLSIQEWIDIIDQSIKIGIRRFHFSGKEPFCDHRIFLLLNHLNQLSTEYHLTYGLVSNGTLLTPKLLQDLLESNMSYLELSLEGDMGFNLSVRNTNSYESIYSLIKDCPDKSKINITSTFFGNNNLELIKMIDAFIAIGVKKFNIAPYLRFDNKFLQPIEELDSVVMIDLLERLHLFLETNNKHSVDVRICVSKEQAYKMFIKQNSLTNSINQYLYNGKRIVFEIGESILEVNFPLLNIPFLSQMIITTDGIVIPCADDIHYKNLKEISIGTIGDGSMVSVMARRKEFIMAYINQNLHIT